MLTILHQQTPFGGDDGDGDDGDGGGGGGDGGGGDGGRIPGQVQAPIPSRPGITYPVRAPPLTPI